MVSLTPEAVLRFAVFALIALVPELAFACFNSMVVRIETYPLDFAHFGIFAAALLLLRWRGQPKRPRHEWDTEDDPAIYVGPSLERELAYLAVLTIATVGVGLFWAENLAIEYTALTGKALVEVCFIILVLALSRVRFLASFWVLVRRVVLLVVALTALNGATLAYDGYYSKSAPFGQQPDVVYDGF